MALSLLNDANTDHNLMPDTDAQTDIHFISQFLFLGGNGLYHRLDPQ